MLFNFAVARTRSQHITLWLTMAVVMLGIGSLWSLPPLLMQQGGSAFLLLYVLAKLLVAVPVQIAECWIGRYSRSSPGYASDNLMLHQHRYASRWRWLGGLMLLAAALLFVYQALMASWVGVYVYQFAYAPLHQVGPEQMTQFFLELLHQPVSVALSFALLALWLGLLSIPYYRAHMLLFIWASVIGLGLMILFFVLWGLAQHSLVPAAQTLLAWRAQQLSEHSLIYALGYAFLTSGVGMGALLWVSRHLPNHASIGRLALTLSGVELLFSLLLSLIVVSLVSTQPWQQADMIQLLFQLLPLGAARQGLPAQAVALFYLLIYLMILTTASVLLETLLADLNERWPRLRPINAVGLIGLGLGLAWLLGQSLVHSRSWLWYGIPVHQAILFVTTTLLLPWIGMLLAILVGWTLPPERVRATLVRQRTAGYALWLLCLRWLTALLIGVSFSLFVAQMTGVSWLWQWSLLLAGVLIHHLWRGVKRHVHFVG